jgi:uncharacterized damage-inducible protein DinB
VGKKAMNGSALLDLVRYNQWASDRVLRRLHRLSARQLRGRALLSYGSVMGTLVHVIDTQWYWRTACEEGVVPLERLSQDDFPDVRSLREYWGAEDERLIRFVRSRSESELARRAFYRWPRARPRSKVLWQIIVHIVNHGTHHRSEVGRVMAGMLASPGDIDFIRFVARR